MTLNIQRIDIRISNFMRSAREMPSEDIEADWYKRDENDELIKDKNFQNNILKILIKQLVDQFKDSDVDRAEIIESILQFLNDFIEKRFIPGAYHEAIKKVFNRTKETQHKPVMQVANTVFKELSETAQKAFRDEGVRVQTNGLEQAPTGRNIDSMRADPILVEILFMQLVWDAQKRNGTRQELLDIIEKSMVKMERLFGNDSTYTIVGTFSSLRSTLVDEAQKESPLPVLVKYIIGLITDTEIKRELEEENKELLNDKTKEEWKEITKEKAKPAISIWQKKEVVPQMSEEEKRKEAKRAEKKRKKKAEKEGLEKLKEDAIDSAKSKGIETAKSMASNAFNSAIGNVSDLLGQIIPGGKSGPGSSLFSGNKSTSNFGGLSSVFGG